MEQFSKIEGTKIPQHNNLNWYNYYSTTMSIMGGNSIVVIFLSASWILCSATSDINNSRVSGSISSQKFFSRNNPFGARRPSFILQISLLHNDCGSFPASNSMTPCDLLSVRTASLMTSRALLKVRGGDDSSEEIDDNEEYDDDTEEEDFDDSSSDYSEEEDDDEDDDDTFDRLDLDGDDDDFKEENTFDRLVEAFHTTPPLTKAYLTSSFVATFLGAIFTNNEFPPILALDWKKVLNRFQIWRPFTAFLNLGSFGLLSYPMTIHFVHQYMSSLERASHNKPYDFWIMILFGMTSMLVGYPIMKLNARFLGHNISTFLTYIWSRMYEGVDVGVFDFIHIKAEVLPWFMLAQVRNVNCIPSYMCVCVCVCAPVCICLS